jgi:hypothetical protein
LDFASLYIKIQDQGNAKTIHGFWSLQMLWTVYTVFLGSKVVRYCHAASAESCADSNPVVIPEMGLVVRVLN